MEPLQNVLIVLCLVTITMVGVVWYIFRSLAILERWAEGNGCRIIDYEYRHVFRGPFFWSLGHRQVYRVTVEDPNGKRRSGWIRCGGFLFGVLFSDRVAEKWDEPE